MLRNDSNKHKLVRRNRNEVSVSSLAQSDHLNVFPAKFVCKVIAHFEDFNFPHYYLLKTSVINRSGRT